MLKVGNFAYYDGELCRVTDVVGDVVGDQVLVTLLGGVLLLPSDELSPAFVSVTVDIEKEFEEGDVVIVFTPYAYSTNRIFRDVPEGSVGVVELSVDGNMSQVKFDNLHRTVYNHCLFKPSVCVGDVVDVVDIDDKAFIIYAEDGIMKYGNGMVINEDTDVTVIYSAEDLRRGVPSWNLFL